MFKELKKYKTWWLISFVIFGYFSANLVMFAMTGMSLARPSSLEQGVTQCVVMLITFFTTFIPYSDCDGHLK